MAYQLLDDLIKEFLLFRGFTSSLRAFDNDIKLEKEKSYRADRLVDQMLSLISSHDLSSLRDLWQHLQGRLFKRLDPVQNGAALRLESGVLKLYIVNCVQTKRPDKVKEFFEKMAVELQGAAEWRDWFALPFLQNPENHPSFQGHFSRQWQDTLLLSLHNFLAIVFARLPAPRLAEFQTTGVKLKRLREENDVLRQTLIRQRQQATSGVLDGSSAGSVRFPDVGVQPRDLMDDFYIIAQQESFTSQASTSENQVKTLKSFLRNITGGSSVATVGTPSPSHNTNALTTGSIDKKAKRLSQEDRAPDSNRKSMGDSSGGKTIHTPLKRVAQSVPSFAQDNQAASTESTDSGSGRLAYLLLGQEEYKEHHSEITQCKFSGSRSVIGSSDVSGVVKIWSASPGVPQTMATFVSNCSVTSLDWLSNSDRHFVYGTSNGTVRLCDIDERKVVTEMTASLPSAVQSVQQITCSPSNGSVIAISTASIGDPSVKGSLMLYDVKTSTYLERDLTGSLDGSVAGIIPIMTSCLFNHNSQMLLTGATDGKIRIFDLRKHECIASWSVAEESEIVSSRNVLSLQLSSDETRIYALTADGFFSAWSFVQTSQKLFGAPLEDVYFQESSQYPRSCWGKQFAFAGDGKHFLCCSTNGGVIYEVRAGGVIDKVLGLKGHRSHATCTDWSASNDCGPCVTAGVDGQIRISTLLSQ